MALPVARSSRAAALPKWIRPQLTQLVAAAPEGDQWLHEIKFDGYRLHARLDHGAVTLLTRTGLDWTHKYPAIAKAVTALDARQAYLDGELCGIGPDGIPSFNIVQLASDRGNAASLMFFLFDLLYLSVQGVRPRPLIERKNRLNALLVVAGPCLRYNDHIIGQGSAFYEKACALRIEGRFEIGDVAGQAAVGHSVPPRTGRRKFSNSMWDGTVLPACAIARRLAQHHHRIDLRGRAPFPLHDARRLRPARPRSGDPAGTRRMAPAYARAVRRRGAGGLARRPQCGLSARRPDNRRAHRGRRRIKPTANAAGGGQ